MYTWKKHCIWRFLAKVLAFLMVILAWPLWELRQSYQWSLDKYLMPFNQVIGMLSTATAEAATLDVCPSGCTYSTIQAAINAASTGDTVLVDDGTYVEKIDFNGKAITVQSVNGAASTTIDGNANGSVVTFSSGEGANSVLDGFTITNGLSSGIRCSADSSPTITHCTISDNESRYSYGGGIACRDSSSPTITNCTISNNLAYYGSGGGISCLDSSSPTITDCTISDNVADYYGGSAGGGIFCGSNSSPTITNCTISGNFFKHKTATGNGGGIYCGGSATIANCTITGNSATTWGGGISCSSPSATITDCTITSNSAPQGGGVYCGGSGTISNCTISSNTADSTGGGIACSGSSPMIDNCTISNNTASLGGTSLGGGIFCSYGSSPTITNCTITGNIAASGGAIRCENSSSPTITHCSITDNSGGISCRFSSSPTIANCAITDNGGSGIWCEDGSLMISNCTITDNSGCGISWNGYSSSRSATITNCTIIGNSGGTGGGGIRCEGAWYIITNCIISGNSAYYGGGIYSHCPTGMGDCIITNCTISGNMGSIATGIFCHEQSSVTVVNSIVWDNDIDSREPSSITITYSDIQGGYQGEGNIDADPLFMDVSDPDPANWDLHLQPTSPCIDKGDNSAVPLEITTDFEGDRRICDGDANGSHIVDMGADELFVGVCEGDFDGDGDVDGSDLAEFAADFGRTDCDTGEPCAGDFDGDDDVDGSDLAVFAADFGRTDCPPVTCTDTIVDGDFEMGTPNPSWTESSTNFGTPICNVGNCGTGGGTGPYQGQYWAWFGGADNEVGSVSQDVTIMIGANTLRFYMELPVCEIGSWDWFEIRIDGNQVYYTDGNDPQCNTVGYQERNVNIAAYADGGVHTIQFRGLNDVSNVTNFFVDSIQFVCD